MKLNLIFFALIVLEVECKVDDVCSVDGVEFGILKPIMNCQYVKRLMKGNKMNEVNKLKQGRDGSRWLYCCPARKALRMCKFYGNNPSPAVSASRIVGGEMAEIGEFPHFASLGSIEDKDGQLVFNCGGSLISDRFVITAAHCCSQNRQAPIIVRLGKTTLNPDDYDNVLEIVRNGDIDIEDIILHPDYKMSEKYNDLALIKLKRSAEFVPKIWPACLAPEKEITPATQLIVAGFGRTDLKDQTKRSEWLMKGSVTEFPLHACKTKYEEEFNKTLVHGNIYQKGSIKGLPHGIDESMICASNRQQHVDTCQGDSGSGLQVLIDDVYYIHGVTSFGLSCNTRLPSFYTRVSSYLDWIEKIVWS